MQKAVVIKDTLTKIAPVQASYLLPKYVKPLSAGQTVLLKSTQMSFGHAELADGWFVFAKHLQFADEKTYIQIATELIARYEGLRLEAYLCPAKIPTIGFGSTRYPTGAQVKLGDKITKEQAQTMLAQNIVSFEAKLKQLPEWPQLNSNQKAALISFAYNVGTTAYRDSTLRKRILSGAPKAEIEAQFKRWNKAGNQELLGLTRRRAEEAKLFTTLT